MERADAISPPVERAVRDFRARLEAQFGKRLSEMRLFGSQARGDAGPESDVDVLVVIEGLSGFERRAVYELAEEVFFDSLLRLAPLALSRAEWEAMRGRELLLAEDIEREGVPL